MVWSELQRVPNEYNDELRLIDEAILKLIQQRRHLSNGRRMFPPQEILQQFASQYDLEIPQINGFLHSLTSFNPVTLSQEPGELTTVVPIMKKKMLDGFEYRITHVMQHDNGSMVHVEIKSENADPRVSIRPHLLLEVKGHQDNCIRRYGSRGSAGQAQLQFWVCPRLPNDSKAVEFSLLPFAIPAESPPQEMILNREVRFE